MHNGKKVNPWRQFPLIRLIIPVLTGTAAGTLISNEFHFPVILIVVLFVLLALIVFARSHFPSFRNQWLAGAIIFLLAFFLSFENCLSKRDTYKNDYFMNCTADKRFYIGDIVEQPVRKQKTIKVILQITGVQRKGAWQRSSGKAMVYLEKDSLSEKLFFADRILFRAEFYEPGGTGFPNTFDQRKFLRNQGISYMAFLKSGQWKRISLSGKGLFQRTAFQLRSRLLQILTDNGMQGREFAVTAALLLGYVDEIDKGIMRDYSATGAMHILSVSGMHVGIIFIVLDKLLGFIKRVKYAVSVRTGIAILVIWFYAMLTGLSPAVLRAAAMISLVVIGKAMKRQPEVLNILAASFLILIINDPYLMVNVGFQLSYMAVVGIVLLYKPVYDLYITSKYIPDKMWSIVAVSIAAQIVTFPLSFYYFHQFPNYFIFTNILVVPLSSLVIYTGILLLVLGSVPVLSFCLAKFLIGQVWFMNQSLHFFEELPFSVSSGIYINAAQVICIYLIVIMLFLFAFYKFKVYLFIGLIFSICLAGSFLPGRIEQFRTGKIIFYGAKNIAALNLVNERTSFLFCSPGAKNNIYFEENHNATCTSLGVSTFVRKIMVPEQEPAKSFTFDHCLFLKGDFIQFYDRRIGFLDRKLPKVPGKKIRLDYLVLTRNPKVTLASVQAHFNAKEIIIDPSNSRWRAERWKAEAAGKGIKVRIISETGAITAEIKNPPGFPGDLRSGRD